MTKIRTVAYIICNVVLLLPAMTFIAINFRLFSMILLDPIDDPISTALVLLIVLIFFGLTADLVFKKLRIKLVMIILTILRAMSFVLASVAILNSLVYFQPVIY